MWTLVISTSHWLNTGTNRFRHKRFFHGRGCVSPKLLDECSVRCLTKGWRVLLKQLGNQVNRSCVLVAHLAGAFKICSLLHSLCCEKQMIQKHILHTGEQWLYECLQKIFAECHKTLFTVFLARFLYMSLFCQCCTEFCLKDCLSLGI